MSRQAFESGEWVRVKDDPDDQHYNGWRGEVKEVREAEVVVCLWNEALQTMTVCQCFPAKRLDICDAPPAATVTG